ncbi:phasin family protein [Rhizobium helianthi]|uniref:Phasin family protein n=1 Tax=Rhizobium helianthi TaxID=1132695 RepID=A0ABW4M1N5_9HYPH
MFNLDDANRKTKEVLDGMLKNYSDVAKGLQAIATENTDYSRKVFQDFTAHMERLMGVRNIESALELQTGYAKSSYEGFVAQSTRLGELYTDLGKTVTKPFEAAVVQSTALVKRSA